ASALWWPMYRRPNLLPACGGTEVLRHGRHRLLPLTATALWGPMHRRPNLLPVYGATEVLRRERQRLLPLTNVAAAARWQHVGNGKALERVALPQNLWAGRHEQRQRRLNHSRFERRATRRFRSQVL